MKKSFRNCVMLFAVALLAAMAWGTEQADAASQVRINSHNFPDKAIRKVARSYDKNKNGYLSPKEISKIKKVSLKKTKYGDGTTNYKGLERFTNLRVLRCREHMYGKGDKEIVLDLSKNKKLEELHLGDNHYGSVITKLKLTNCKKLKVLDVTQALRLKKIDLRGCAALKEATILYGHRLTSLDFSSCHKLKKLWVQALARLSKLKLGDINNVESLEVQRCRSLKTLDVKRQTRLKYLDVSKMPLQKIDIRNNVQLEGLSISEMSFTKIDVRNNTRLESLSLREVPVTKLDLKNQKKLKGIMISETKLKRLDLTSTKITKERCRIAANTKPLFEYYCYVEDKNIDVVFADGETMTSPIYSFDWK